MRPGDLLFYPATPRSEVLSRIIGAFELLLGQGNKKTQYSHVSIAGRAQVQYEAWVPFSRSSSIDPAASFEVWRPAGATEEQGKAATAWALDHVGQPYDAGRFFLGLFKTKNSNICSTFAASAWKDNGFDLARTAGRWITPNDLMASGLLEFVEEHNGK